MVLSGLTPVIERHRHLVGAFASAWLLGALVGCAAPNGDVNPSSATLLGATPATEATTVTDTARLRSLAEQERAAFIETLRELVNIESGSRDLEGLAKIADVIAKRLTALGGDVRLIDTSAEMTKLEDAPAKVGSVVHASFKGTGRGRVMLIAHMDTVYLRGMLAQQPFKVEGNRAWGLGVADDKQGIAVILHTVALLQKSGFKDFAQLTVLINGDEEISSPGSRTTITRMAREHDVVLSYEGGGPKGEVRLATSGIGAASLKVVGRASHAGAAPEKGANALTELAHQVLQLGNLSKPDQGLHLNWTLAKAGSNRNVIPAEASAQADARALRVADFDGLQTAMAERIKTQRVPDAKVSLNFEVRRPPLEANAASRRLAAHAQTIYREMGLAMPVLERATGGGTDAAFAALGNSAAVVEGMGLSGYGAHSNDAEYVLLDTLVPRLVLSARLIMDVAHGQVK